ncbi:MAG: cbb3-type cytochrome c oxidase subunit 3 [Proteobacteria bacterium]|nr:cbb3-type cytochrome c oxidase subunit 3 [Pseudomonadota bacterium]
MNPVWGEVAGVFIVAMMIAFIGIWVWAWLPYHKRTFDALARMPMQDDSAARVATEDKP